MAWHYFPCFLEIDTRCWGHSPWSTMTRRLKLGGHWLKETLHLCDTWKLLRSKTDPRLICNVHPNKGIFWKRKHFGWFGRKNDDYLREYFDLKLFALHLSDTYFYETSVFDNQQYVWQYWSFIKYIKQIGCLNSKHFQTALKKQFIYLKNYLTWPGLHRLYFLKVRSKNGK